MTPDIIAQSISQPKKCKADGNHGFKSDHLINVSHQLHVFMSSLFNVMLSYGCNAKGLLISSIL